MKITMLGTGEALVTECYNTCFILHEDSDYFMVDGGGGIGILRQLKYAGFDWRDIKEIFVTHRHTDHLFGVIWLVRVIGQAMHNGEYEGEMNIYAHEEVIFLIKDIACKLCSPRETDHIGNRIHLIAVSDGEKRTICRHNITFFDIHSCKAKQFGFCMELDGGEKLTCCGDEPYNQYEEKYVKNSKWLLHEAFCLYGEADIFRPYEISHSTVRDACELAEKMNIQNLLLYHTEDKNIKDRKNLYIKEGENYYKGNLYIPNDLETLEI